MNPKDWEKKGLVGLYKKAFDKHNIFKKSASAIEDYLSTQTGIMAEEDDQVVGAVVFELKEKAGTHSLWKIKHLAVLKEYEKKGIGKGLLKDALAEIKKKVNKTAKIEICVSENEKKSLKLYVDAGFKKEGVLSSHYRNNESATVLGKKLRK